ncbi:DUF3892 domain-containing protein [Kribbella sp. NBC_00709]
MYRPRGTTTPCGGRVANDITHRRMSAGGTLHEHIVKVKGQSGNGTFENTVSEIVEMIESGKYTFVVTNGTKPAAVRVRVSSSGRKYIQTVSDGIWTNNLLALPTF